MAKLKPCPLCGGEAEINRVGMYVQIRCTKCPLDFGRYWFGYVKKAIDMWNERVGDRQCVVATPSIEAVEVVDGYSVGDFCIYGFAKENKSLAIVEIVKILDDERGVAEVKFHKVITDDTGNGLFDYLLRSGGTMNASFKYLKNITPKGE